MQSRRAHNYVRRKSYYEILKRIGRRAEIDLWPNPVTIGALEPCSMDLSIRSGVVYSWSKTDGSARFPGCNLLTDELRVTGGAGMA